MSRNMLFAACVAIAAITTTAPALASAQAPSDCPPGAFCLYTQRNQGGKPVRKDFGNNGANISGIHSVYNNGTPETYDHVKVSYTFKTRGDGGPPETVTVTDKCVHRGYSEGRMNLPSGIAGEGSIVTNVRWVGAWECD